MLLERIIKKWLLQSGVFVTRISSGYTENNFEAGGFFKVLPNSPSELTLESGD